MSLFDLGFLWVFVPFLSIAFTSWVPQNRCSGCEWDPGKLLAHVLAQGCSWFICVEPLRGIWAGLGACTHSLAAAPHYFGGSCSILRKGIYEEGAVEPCSGHITPAPVNKKERKLICNLKL